MFTTSRMFLTALAVCVALAPAGVAIADDGGLAAEQNATQAAARSPIAASLVTEELAAQAADEAQRHGDSTPSITTQPTTFHWGDAGIGGAAAALLLLSAGAALVLVRRRGDQVPAGRRTAI